jgi:uncharacterized protein (TIGR02246 family)
MERCARLAEKRGRLKGVVELGRHCLTGRVRNAIKRRRRTEAASGRERSCCSDDFEMSISTDRAEIEAATATLLAAVNSGDVRGVVSVWSEDGVLMPPNHASVHGRAAIETYFRELFERFRFRFAFNESETSVDGDTAIQRIRYTAEVWVATSTAPSAVRGKGLHVYKREPSGAWKLAIDIWNTDEPSPATPQAT